jgi:hypothetical protein
MYGRDRQTDWLLSSRAEASPVGRAGGPIGEERRAEWEPNGAETGSLRQKRASSLDHVLGLLADEERR